MVRRVSLTRASGSKRRERDDLAREDEARIARAQRRAVRGDRPRCQYGAIAASVGRATPLTRTSSARRDAPQVVARHDDVRTRADTGAAEPARRRRRGNRRGRFGRDRPGAARVRTVRRRPARGGGRRRRRRGAIAGVRTIANGRDAGRAPGQRGRDAREAVRARAAAAGAGSPRNRGGRARATAASERGEPARRDERQGVAVGQRTRVEVQHGRIRL